MYNVLARLGVNFITRRIHNWLISLECDSGRFAFCRQGNLTPTSGHAAHMATIFAVKIAWQTGVWQDWSQSTKQSCIAFLQSFQDKDGWVRDPWVLEHYSKYPDAAPGLQETIRAETRQLLSLLLTLDVTPLYAPPLELNSSEALTNFIRALDWSNPWAAASHWSHQAFLLAAAKTAGKDVSQLEATLLSLLDEYYQPDVGCWFDAAQRPPTTSIQINGAMKVFTGLAWLPVKPMNHKSLIHFCLTTLPLNDSCSLLNTIYVLQQAVTSHDGKLTLPGEVKKAVLRLVWQVMRYYRWQDGAFSFYPNRAQHSYYAGIPTSLGLKAADLHGTAMQTWALALALRFFDNADACGWTTQRV